MKRILRFVARLYPARWRGRYGHEFEALLEDVNADSRAVWDVFVGALKMQIATWNFASILAACGVAGAVIGAGVSFTMPVRYVSTVALRWQPAAAGGAVVPQIRELVMRTFSTESLAGLVKRQHLDEHEGAREPMEETMKRVRHDTRIVAGRRGVFDVSFISKDAGQAARVTNDITATLAAAAAEQNHRLYLLTDARLATRPASPNRAAFAALGLCAGLLAGAAAHQLRGHAA